MKRIVIVKKPGGSIPGRPLPSGKRSLIPLKVGRNVIDQADLDVAMGDGWVRALFEHGRLVLEPVPDPVQPPVAPVAPKAKAVKVEEKAKATEPVTIPETPSAKAEEKAAKAK